jgi:Rieske Fe-S protein
MSFEKNTLPRRDFITDLILASVAIKCVALLAMLADYWRDDYHEKEFSGKILDDTGHAVVASTIEAGSVRTAMNNGNKILLIHEGAFFWALSRECTHRSCKVSWDTDKKTIRCGCHGSRFGITGEVIKGPAKRSLQKVDLKIEGDFLMVHRPPDGKARS